MELKKEITGKEFELSKTAFSQVNGFPARLGVSYTPLHEVQLIACK